MKTTLLLKGCLILAILVATGCATSKPDVWIDEYGIVHREHVEAGEVAAVKIVNHEPAIGCKRLRDFELDGRMRHAWDIKEATAKQGGTHVIRTWGRNTTIGFPYDCRNYRQVANERQAQELWIKRRALEELERRRRARGNDIQMEPYEEPKTKGGLPVRKFNASKD